MPGIRLQVSAVSLRQKLSELKRRHADKLGKSYRACSKGRRNPSLSKVASESAQATSSGCRAEGSSSPSATLSATSRLSPLELDGGTRVIEPKAGRPVQSCAAGFENRAKSCKADRSGLDHASGAQSSESSRDSVACNVGFEKSSPCEKNKFSGLCHSDLLIIEICAGTAVLSKCAKQHGFRTLPIDRSKIRSKGSDILVMDLANPCQASCVKEIVSTEASRILAIFFLHLLVVPRQGLVNVSFATWKARGSKCQSLCDQSCAPMGSRTSQVMIAPKLNLQTNCMTICVTSLRMHAVWMSCA